LVIIIFLSFFNDRFAAKKLKKKDLAVVDHNQVKYEPFRKDFYIEPPEMHDMTPDQVDLLRVELDGIKIRVSGQH